MFVTTEPMRLPLSLEMGVHIRKGMEIELPLPFVLVSETQKEGSWDAGSRGTFLLRAELLTSLLTSPQITVHAVELLSPAGINGSRHRMLEPPQEIWSCQEADGASANLFRVPQRWYTDSIYGTCVDDLRPIGCIFDHRSHGKAR